MGGRSRSSALLRAAAAVLVVTLAGTLPADAARAPPAVQCSVCRHVVAEVEKGIADTKETHTVQVAFRMDEKVRVPYARSEYRLYEVVEPVCGRLKHGHAVRGGTRLVRTADHRGDPSLLDSSRGAVKDIQRACAAVLDDYQEEVVLAFHRSVDDVAGHICGQLTSSCAEGEAASLAEQEARDREADDEHVAKKEAAEKRRREEEAAAEVAAAAEFDLGEGEGEGEGDGEGEAKAKDEL